SLSSVRSDTAFRSRLFSSSSSFKRLTCSICNPPNSHQEQPSASLLKLQVNSFSSPFPVLRTLQRTAALGLRRDRAPSPICSNVSFRQGQRQVSPNSASTSCRLPA